MVIYSLVVLLFQFWTSLLFPCKVLTIVFCPASRFLKRQVKWSDIPICLRIFQFVVIHPVNSFSVDNEADVFLEFPCFFNDPVDVGSFISGSSAFSKTSLNIWKFTVHVLLKPSLEDLEHDLASMKWLQLCGHLNILWDCLSLGLEWKLTLFSPVATAEFSKFASILSSAL